MSERPTEQNPAAQKPVEHNPVDCTEALSKLFEFLDSEISEADCDRIREHLADCEPCLAEYDIEDHLKKLVKRSCHESAPAELHVRIRRTLVVMQTTPTSGGSQASGSSGSAGGD